MIPPTQAVLVVVFKVLKDGFVGWLFQLFRRGGERKTFWEHAKQKHPERVVEDIYITAKVMQVFLLLPIFFSLFDQSSSRWVLQGELLNRDLYFFTISGDQLNMLNPLFTLSLIPVFQFVIYPACRKFGLEMKPIEHKISIGLTITGFSFLLSYLLQLAIDQSPPNTIYIFAAIPQQLVLSTAEVMVSITGLEVAYSQAPPSMKSMVMAGWLLTTGTGNLLVAVMSALDWPKSLAGNFLFYTVLMFICAVAFYLWNRNFKYRTEVFAPDPTEASEPNTTEVEMATL